MEFFETPPLLIVEPCLLFNLLLLCECDVNDYKSEYYIINIILYYKYYNYNYNYITITITITKFIKNVKL